MQRQEMIPQGSMWRIFETLQQLRSYAKGQIIYQQGDRADLFYYVRKGRVRIFLSSESGMEKTLTVRERGNVFGEAAFFDGQPRMSSAMALTRCEIIAVDRAALLRLFGEQPDLAMHMLQYLARTVRMLSSQLDNMTFLQADRRIAQLLLEMGAHSEATPPLVHCTHEELGELAGCSRVTVSKTLDRFARLGWLETKYRAVVIKNKAALSQFATQPADGQQDEPVL